MADSKKKDPTVTGNASAEPSAGWHPARPVEEASDAAVNRRYEEMPGKPDPSTVAQIEVPPDE